MEQLKPFLYLYKVIELAEKENCAICINFNPHIDIEVELHQYTTDLINAGRLEPKVAADCLLANKIYEVIYIVQDGHYFSYASDIDAACKQLLEEMKHA